MNIPNGRNRTPLRMGLATAVLLALALSGVSLAHADTTLVLDRIPSPLYRGDAVTFSGTLSDGRYAVSGATIHIKDDDFGPDDLIARAVTDGYGNFAVTVSVKDWDEWGGDADIYAVFEGSGSAEKARSPTQKVRVSDDVPGRSAPAPVEPTRTFLALDTIPSPLQLGDTVTFSGRLMTEDRQYVIPGAAIHVKDDDPGFDDTIAQTVTDGNGYFAVSVTVRDWDEWGGDVDIYAVYEGSSDIKKARSFTQKVGILYEAPSELTLQMSASSVYALDAVTFSGWLTDSDGYGLADRTVEIKEDRFGSDRVLERVRTDYNGHYYAEWIASQEGTLDVYAVFEGDSTTAESRSQGRSLHVTEYSPVLTLDPVPPVAYEGDLVTFSGRMTGPDGTALMYVDNIHIKDEDPGSGDDLLATTRTDGYGRFEAVWVAENVDADREADIYAVWEADGEPISARTAEQQLYISRHSASLTLDSPSGAYLGSAITFSGRLTGSDGYGLADRQILIKDEDTLNPDDLLASGWTDSRGYYSISWTASKKDVGEGLEVFAVFEGDGTYPQARSQEHGLDVTKYGGSLVLDPVPSSAHRGERIFLRACVH